MKIYGHGLQPSRISTSLKKLNLKAPTYKQKSISGRKNQKKAGYTGLR
jgi:hypothetical protein